MAVNSKSFEVMYGLMSAIKQIDRIIAKNNSEDILEDVMTAVKEINLDQFDSSIKKNIVENIRAGLVNMYEEQIIEANKEIGIATELSEIGIVHVSEALDPDTIIKTSVSDFRLSSKVPISDLKVKES